MHFSSSTNPENLQRQATSADMDDGGRSSSRNDDDVELQWAAIDRLPTLRRLQMSVFDEGKVTGGAEANGGGGKRVVDVTELSGRERHLLVESLINKVEEDNRRLLQKLKERIDRSETELFFLINTFSVLLHFYL